MANNMKAKSPSPKTTMLQSNAKSPPSQLTMAKAAAAKARAAQIRTQRTGSTAASFITTGKVEQGNTIVFEKSGGKTATKIDAVDSLGDQLSLAAPGKDLEACVLAKGPQGFGLRIDSQGRVEAHNFRLQLDAPPVAALIVGVNGYLVTDKASIMEQLTALPTGTESAEFRYVPAVPEAFVTRVDALCDQVAVLEALLLQLGWTEDLQSLASPSPLQEEIDEQREARRHERQARLDAARARRKSAEARRDALKTSLEEDLVSLVPWKLRITPPDGGDARFRLRIAAAAEFAWMVEEKLDLDATPEGKELTLRSEEHAVCVRGAHVCLRVASVEISDLRDSLTTFHVPCACLAGCSLGARARGGVTASCHGRRERCQRQGAPCH